MLKIKRVYEKYDKKDGFRVLVDRLWPRGVSKQDAHIDVWLKEVAPSTKLRQWFDHDPQKWEEFQKRYQKELAQNPEAVNNIRKFLDQYQVVTFVYSAKDEQYNQARVLYEYFQQNL